jgi:hypothetical protein
MYLFYYKEPNLFFRFFFHFCMYFLIYMLHTLFIILVNIFFKAIHEKILFQMCSFFLLCYIRTYNSRENMYVQYK